MPGCEITVSSMQDVAVFGGEGVEFVEGAAFEFGYPLWIGQQGASDCDEVELYCRGTGR